MADPMMHALARELVALKRHIRQVEVASQGSHRSIENGAIDTYDDAGVLRERFGKQADGSYGRKSLSGEIPPAPSEPDVMVLNDGLIAVTWDGRFEERYGGDFRNVQVHLGDTPTFACTRATQEGAIFARRGGTVLCVTESDDDNPVYVRFVAANNAREESAPSDATLVDESDPDELDEGDDELEFYQDSHTVTVVGAQTIALSHEPEQDSEHLYWGVLYQPGSEWSRVGQMVTVPDLPVKVDDVLTVEYAHLAAGAPPLSLDWASPGWKYLTVTNADTTDRSGTGYDDTAWTVAPAPFGNGGSGKTPASVTNVFASNAGIWLRRDVAGNPGSGVDVSVKVDNEAWVYWNGVEIGTTYDVPTTFNVPPGDVLEVNVVAILAHDYAGPTYLDSSLNGAGAL